MIHLPPDFKELLQFLNEKKVEYLVVGGYAVGFYGYPRSTGDMDLWIAFNPENLRRVADALQAFGFSVPEPADSFLQEGQFIGLGNAPLRIEILSSISGVTFKECYDERTSEIVDGVTVNIIALRHLKINKQSTGRHKDLNDLENLP